MAPPSPSAPGDGDRASPCVFCEIVAGRQPAHVVARTGSCTAFLDTRPLFPGHTLVVPDEHHVTLPDLPETLLVPVFGLARRIAAVMGDALGAAGTFVAVNNVVSQSVPHLHVHVVPRNRKDGLRGFFWPRTSYASDDDAAAVAAGLAAALDG
jgi:histidine triad (HIT) family protein